MLRTDLFKTVDRVETRFIAVRDTLTTPDPSIDVKMIDNMHCRRGRLGIGWHFLIQTNGVIQLARRIDTVGSHTRNYDTVSVAIGVVGGTDAEGQRVNTRTPEQLDALNDLIVFLSEKYPQAELSDNPDPN